MFRLARPTLRSQTQLLAAATGIAATAGIYTLYTSSASSEPNSDTSESQPKRTFGSGPAFTSLQLHSVEKLNHDTSRFRFSLPEPNAVSGLSLTSALLTVTRPNGQWRPVIRPYTPTSDLDEPGFIDLTIKKYPNGQASGHIHSLTPGDSLFILAPLKAYSWRPNEVPNVTLIAGGAGITPIMQLLKGIFSNPEETTKVTLLFGINKEEDALFRPEFRSYEQRFPGRFKVVYTVTNPSPGSEFNTGRVTKQLIESQVTKEEIASGKTFVCGPPAMEEALLGKKGNGGILAELGVRKDQIYKF